MSTDNAFLATFLRGIRDACLGNVTFNSRITISGFLCISVDANYQSQFVVDEVFDKQNHEGTNNSYCLKKIDIKGARSHFSQRQCHKEARPKGQGSQIPEAISMRNVGRRRNKPYCTVKSQCAYPSKPRTPPGQCQVEANTRSQRRTATGDSRFPEISYSPSQNNEISTADEHRSELHNSKRTLGPHAKAQSNLSLHLSPDKLSSRSQLTHTRTNTRHFFRSSSRNEKNNTTFTLDGHNVLRSDADKDTATQNKASRETSFSVVRNFNKPFGQVNPRKSVQNLSKTTSEKQMSEVARRNTFEPIRTKFTNKIYRDAKTVPRNLSEQKKEYNQSFNYSQTNVKERKLKLNGSTETLSYHNSYISCLSGTDFDVSYDFEMNNFDENDYLSEQDVSIIATEPPYGFLETNIDPYNYVTNYPNVENETNSNVIRDTHRQFPVGDRETSPIYSEPLIRSSEKPRPREVYSDGNILDNNLNLDVNKTPENPNHFISRERMYQSNSTIKSALSPDPKSKVKHIECKQQQQQIIQKPPAIDDNLKIESKSHQRNYGDGNTIWEQEMKNTSNELTSFISHPNSKSGSREDYMAARREQIHQSSHQGTSSHNNMGVSLQSASSHNEVDFVPLVTTVKPRPRAWRSFMTDEYINVNDTIHKTPGGNCKSASYNHGDAPISGETASSRPVYCQRSPLVVGVRPRPAQGAHEYRDLNNLQGSAISQVSVKGQASAGSQGSAGDYGQGTEVRDSPSVIKKKSRLRKWMRIFKKDSSPMPLRGAHHMLPVPSPTESHTSVNWTLRNRHRLPVCKKKVNPGDVRRTKTKEKDSKAGVRF